MKKSKILGAILLISGVTIGAGMLGLPIKTGLGGFLPALIAFTICWCVMLWTAYLFLELNLSLNGNNINLISMAKKTFGRPGQILMWFIYLLQLNALIVAYLCHGGELFLRPLENIIGFKIHNFYGQIFLLSIFCPFIYFGLNSVDYLNRFLMIGLGITFILMILLVSPQVQTINLQHVNYHYTLISTAIIIASFGFHIIIPSLTSYLNKDVKIIKFSLFLGTFIPFIIYIIWEFLILGTIPSSGGISISTANLYGIDIAGILYKKLNNNTINITTHLFSIFAVITSLIGVSQSLFDFWIDGLSFSKIGKSKKLLFLLTFGPALIIIIGFKANFLIALDYAGIFVSILLGIFPILMIWKARYYLKLSTPYTVKGGKTSLVLGLILFILIIIIVLGNKIGLFF